MVGKLMRNSIVLMMLVLLSGTALATPQIQHWTTGNGARVYYVEAPELPMLDVRVVFDAGSARDGDLPGLAMITNGLLTDGAGKLDADGIAESIDRVGAQLSVDSLRDMALVSLRTLTEETALKQSLDVLSSVINGPTFEQDDIDRNLQAMKIGLRQEEQAPDEVASKAFYRVLYKDHPYAMPSNGTNESLPLLNRERIVAFHQKYYVAKNAVIVLVGAIDRGRAEQIAEQVIGNLPAGERAAGLPGVHAVKGQREEIAFPSTQSHIYIGVPVLSRDDPDYFPLYVGNHVLGGSGLVSRISEEVREKRGLAYSSYSYFSPMRGPGPFQVGLQTKNSQAREAENVVMTTLKDFIDKGPSAEELESSIQNITGGFPLRIASNKDIVSYLAVIGFYDLPLDYLDTFVDSVKQVTIEQIRDAFQRRVKLDQLSTIVVGQPGEA
jgi:zinc protease